MSQPRQAHAADRVRYPDRLAHPVSGAELILDRAWPRGEWHVLLEFRTPSGDLLPAQWFADAVRRAGVFAATGGAVDLPGHGVVLHPDGADRRLAALGEVLARPGSRLVVHRPERRAVVRLAGGCYAKVVRPGREAGLLRWPAELAGVMAGAAELPRVMPDGHRPPGAGGVVVLSELSGPTLHEAGRDGCVPDRELSAGWQRLGTALRLLHGGPVPADAARHDAAAEAAVATGWLDAAVTYGLLPPVDAAAALAPLLAPPRAALGLLHRDLHDKQVILGPRGDIGLLDLDTVAVGERALDVANVLVHLDLRIAQGLLTPSRAQAARTAFLAGLAPDTETLARVPAYEQAARLRLAGVYAFRPRWRGLARTLLAAVAPEA